MVLLLCHVDKEKPKAKSLNFKEGWVRRTGIGGGGGVGAATGYKFGEDLDASTSD